MASYVDEVLADTPYAYWRCNENAGATSCADSGSLGQAQGSFSDFTLGNTAFISGDTSGKFGGSGAGLTHTASIAAYTGDLTIEGWITTEVNGDLRYFAGQRNGSGGVSVGKNAANQLILLSTGLTLYTFTSSSISINTAYYVVFVLHSSGGNCDLYVNGSSVQTVAGSGVSGATGGSPYYLGQCGATTSGSGQASAWQGRVGEVAVYHALLSSARITAHWNARNNPSYNPGVSSDMAFGTL